MDKETLDKVDSIRQRLDQLSKSQRPIQRRISWLTRKLEETPDNVYMNAELEALSLCWELLKEEARRLKLFVIRLDDILEGDRDGRTNESN